MNWWLGKLFYQILMLFDFCEDLINIPGVHLDDNFKSKLFTLFLVITTPRNPRNWICVGMGLVVWDNFQKWKRYLRLV